MIMEIKESLRQYLTYNKEISEIEQIFYNLDNQLKYLHQKGFCVSELNSDTIFLDTNKHSSQSDHATFIFSSIARAQDIQRDSYNNILDLSKLAIGAFISVDNGFCDYTNLDNNYIKKYFNEMAGYIPNAEYFRGVILGEDTIQYYSDFINKKNTGGKGTAAQMVKANNYGKMYVADDESAFVQIVLYPVLLVTIIAIVAILTKLF